MRILWQRVFALIFAIAALIVLLRHRAAIHQVFAAAYRITDSHAPLEERALGLLGLGLFFIFMLACLRLLLHEDQDRRN